MSRLAEGAGPPILPAFTNLYAVANDLPDKTMRVPIRQALERTWRVQSCLSDLRQARDCCAQVRNIKSITGVPDANVQSTIERSLIFTAVILYARATKTSARHGERGSIQLRIDDLSREQQEDHKTLTTIRDRALAHVYSKEDISGDTWHTDMIYAMQVTPDGWMPASATRQVGVHMPTVQRLERMLPVALDQLTAQYHRRLDKALQLLKDARVPEALFRKHAFDPIKFFGSAEFALRAAESWRDQEIYSWGPDGA